MRWSVPANTMKSSAESGKMVRILEYFNCTNIVLEKLVSFFNLRDHRQEEFKAAGYGGSFRSRSTLPTPMPARDISETPHSGPAGPSMLSGDAGRSLLTHLAADQITFIIVVVGPIHSAAFVGIMLNYGELALAVGVYRFRLAIVVIVPYHSYQFPVLVLFEQIDPAVEVPIALDLDQIAIAEGFDDVRTAVTVGIEGGLGLVMRDCVFTRTGIGVADPARGGQRRGPAGAA
jgi:hypothetical protein